METESGRSYGASGTAAVIDTFRSESCILTRWAADCVPLHAVGCVGHLGIGTGWEESTEADVHERAGDSDATMVAGRRLDRVRIERERTDGSVCHPEQRRTGA